MKVTFILIFIFVFVFAFGNKKAHRENMGKYNAMVAAACSLLLKIKRY